MSTQLQFDLASPQKLHFSKPVAMVVVPGSEGTYGVLPGHAPMDTTLSTGVIEIYETEGTVSERLFVTGGFCEVTGQYCSVMADEVVPVKSLKRDLIEDEIKQLGMEENSDEVMRKLAVAQSKLLAIS